MIEILLNLFDLFFAEMNRSNRRLDKARKHVNRVLNRDHDGFEFLLAYDAVLLIFEDRLPEARSRFEECLDLLSESDSEDHRYIALFCEFYLSIYRSTGQALILRREALELEPETLTKKLLRFPDEEAFEGLWPLSRYSLSFSYSSEGAVQ